MARRTHAQLTIVSLLFLAVACSAETTAEPPTLASLPAVTTPPEPHPTLVHPPTITAVPPVSPTAPPPTTRAYAEYTVQEGDTLLGIAMAHDVPMAAIQLLNQMRSSTVVRTGEVLTIPPQVGWEEASPFWIIHVVAESETLTGIGHRYDVAVDALQSVNGLSDADRIGIGQELIVPLDAPALAEAPMPTTTRVPPTAPPSNVNPDARTPAPPAISAPPPTDVADWPYETVRLINQVRAEHGLPPLAYNENLAAAAQVQANDCAQRGWCSHTGSDGSDIKTRILRAGYDPASWAECWAIRPSPQGAVDIWMDEVPPDDPHRRTLLTTWLTEIGLGVAHAQGDYYYFIADFGQPW
ncbi:MAG: CAP domain-containing protein [Anaerolineae bacterium]